MTTKTQLEKPVARGSEQSRTKVIFRRFRGETLALFPAIAGTCGEPWTCSSYAHVGQHSAATVDLVRVSRPASRAEYAPLARELRRIGYKLAIASRFTRADYAARCAQLGMEVAR